MNTNPEDLKLLIPLVAALFGAIVGGVFTSIISPLLFAPWIEARKKLLLERFHRRDALSQSLKILGRQCEYSDEAIDASGENGGTTNGRFQDHLIAFLQSNAFAGAALDSYDARLITQCLYMGELVGSASHSEIRETAKILTASASLVDPLEMPWFQCRRRTHVRSLINKFKEAGGHVPPMPAE